VIKLYKKHRDYIKVGIVNLIEFIALEAN